MYTYKYIYIYIYIYIPTPSARAGCNTRLVLCEVLLLLDQVLKNQSTLLFTHS